MTIPTQEQIEQFNYKQSKEALKALNKTYPLDTPVSKLTPEQWAQCDLIANALLWLEDRIHSFEDPRVLSMDPKKEIIKAPEPKPAKVTRPARRFSMQGVIYDSVRAASVKTGIKLGTLQTYVSRKPDQYFYIDN